MRTRALGSSLSPLAIAILTVACGSAPPQTETPSPTVAPAVKPTAGPGATTSPVVAEPAGLVALGRWKSPVQSLRGLAACGNLPQELVQMGTGLAGEMLLKEMLPWETPPGQIERLAPLVSLDAPIDMAAALDPSLRSRAAYFAVSFGLTSFERARAILDDGARSVEIAPGVFRIGDGRRAYGDQCALVASKGATPARIVCGENDKSLVALAPWLARGLAAAPLTGASDFHGELRVAAADAKYGPLLRQFLGQLPFIASREGTIGEPLFDEAVVRAATIVQEEGTALAADLDKLSVDFAVTPTDCLTVSAAASFRGKTGLVANTVGERPERQGPPPALFFKLPKDATTASYHRGGDPARLANVRKTLHDLALGALNRAAIGTEADRKQLAGVLLQAGGKDVVGVFASGPSPVKAAPAKKAVKAPSERTEAERSEARRQAAADGVTGVLGWNLYGFEEKPDAVVKALTDLTTVWGRPAIQTAIKKKLRGRDADLVPTAKLVKAPAGLPKGSLEVELRFELPDDSYRYMGYMPPPLPGAKQPKAPPKPKKGKSIFVTISVLVVPDANVTWLAFGADRAELVKRLNSVKGTPAADQTLASRAGLDELKNGKHMSGGYFSLAAITGGLDGALRNLPSGPAAAVSGVVKAMPNKGETPMVFFSTVSGAAAPFTATTTMRVPKGSFADVGSLVQAGIALLGPALGGGRTPAPVAPAPPPPPPGKP